MTTTEKKYRKNIGKLTWLNFHGMCLITGVYYGRTFLERRKQYRYKVFTLKGEERSVTCCGQYYKEDVQLAKKIKAKLL